MHQRGGRRRFTAGEVLMRQGELGDCAYLIESGAVEIFVTQPNQLTVSLGICGAGSWLGEMAIVDSGVRLATARAVADGEALVVTREELAYRLANADPVVRLFTELIVARFRELMRYASIAPHDRSGAALSHDKQRSLTTADTVERLRLASELRAAMAENHLSLRYQPLVAVDTGGISGFEALLRWHNPERGAISPDVFIPVAEETGQIIEITRWALAEACRALTRLEATCGQPGALTVSVNVSSEDLISPDFVERLTKTLGAASVMPSQVRLEITERVMISCATSARDNLARCRAVGFGIAIDDFGTGYSSLSYLNAYPIDTLKIDRSFIVDMHRNADAFALVRSIIGLAKTLRKSVVAEGVESVADLRTLRGLGCDYGQGFYFAEPLTETEAARFLAAWEPANVSV
jgi:EAL domain-containing protein (putative c-di-GMP-specific phosphodiesterase class I)